MSQIDKPTHQNIGFLNALNERYLAYALSTIMSRSLPDVRDGLKPVHRRILYAMLMLKLHPEQGYKKCARIVGDVIGKYHPHGDVAVYDSLVRLAQDFSMRYPLIEGQGNFGSVDGDSAAAMRYTESKLTATALYLMQDLEKDTVNLRPTYDGSEEEPVVFPAVFPNILVNGAEGIAVGMACSIPPHNLEEIINGTVALIKKPNITIPELLNFIKGPDFPTGGTIIDPVEHLIEIYSTGRGSVRIRAKWHSENLSHGLYQIVITEIPYQLSKARLIEKLAELFKDKKLPLINDIRDESAEDIRIIIEPKNRTIDANHVMEMLFKTTELESRINVNLNVLSGKSVPGVMNLKEILQEFIEHRLIIITRRSSWRVRNIINRLEILEGLAIAYLNLDAIIKIIREADDAKIQLQQRFMLTSTQADAILNIRLRSLHKLEEITINKEIAQLKGEQNQLNDLIDSKNKQYQMIIRELEDIKKKFNQNPSLSSRKTDFQIIEHIDISDDILIEKEAITVILSHMGWIKTIKGHEIKEDSIKYKDGDTKHVIFETYTTNKLLLISSMGKAYTISASKISGGKGYGEPLRMICELETNDDIISILDYAENKQFLMTASDGKAFIVNSDDLLAQTKTGKQIMNLKANEEVKSFLEITTNIDHIGIIGENNKLLICSITEIPKIKKGQGVTLQKYKQGKVAYVFLVEKVKGIEIIEKNMLIFSESNISAWISHRGQAGKLAPLGLRKIIDNNNKYK